MSLTRYLRTNLLTAPYALLPLAIFTFFGLCFLFHPFSPLRTGQLSDPDDYMRLNEVINWVSGQSWYDLSQPRLSPGENTIIHWSRLVDLPIALFMLPFISVIGMQKAALLAAFVIPPALFSLLLVLLPALTKPFVGAERANLGTIFVLFAPMILFNFSPGRVDHHGYQILIAGFNLVCLERLVRNKVAYKSAFLAALAFACGLWIGTEALPWLLIFIACLALFSSWKGGLPLTNAALFGVALSLATALILPIALPASEFSSRALSWFSPAYVVFAGLTGLVFVLSWFFGQKISNRFLRVGLVMIFGLSALLFFAYLVPDTTVGPFADYESFNATIALDNIGEAQPLAHAFSVDHHRPLTYLYALNSFLHDLLLPLLALVCILYNLNKPKQKNYELWLIHAAFLFSATLLTLFWQVRVGYFMELFTIAPLTWLALAWWKKIDKELSGRTAFWAELSSFMALGPIPVILIPALFNQAPLYPTIMFFPAMQSASNCALGPVATYLNETYKDNPITILAGMNEGPELLFRTPYKFIGANYNVFGNQDVFDFFNAKNDKTAQSILYKWHASLVLTCRNIAPFLAGIEHIEFGTTTFLAAGKDGKLHLVGDQKHEALIEKLVNGRAPSWLMPVEIPDNKDYLLFKVLNDNDQG